MTASLNDPAIDDTTRDDTTRDFSLEDTLDRLEARLPLIPRRLFRLQRSLAEAGFGVTRRLCGAVFDSTDRVERSARTAVNTVRGQARAQTSMTVETAESEASSLLGRAERAVSGDDTARLEEWTKADLYERAQELDIDGRSGMSKKQLVEALRQPDTISLTSCSA